jgi:hypothetical protein
MCYRPRPERAPAKKTIAAEADRKLQNLEQRLALLERQLAGARRG